MERRTNTRVPFSIDALIRYRERSVTGILLNISLHGMYIELAEEIPLYSDIIVEIILASGNERIICILPGTVIRSGSGGAAVKFTRMNIDSYITIRDLMMNNASDPEAIMLEFRDFISENRIS